MQNRGATGHPPFDGLTDPDQDGFSARLPGTKRAYRTHQIAAG